MAISKYKPAGAYIQKGNIMEGFLCNDFEGLIFGGACTWRGLFSEFYGSLSNTGQWQKITTFMQKCRKAKACFDVFFSRRYRLLERLSQR